MSSSVMEDLLVFSPTKPSCFTSGRSEEKLPNVKECLDATSKKDTRNNLVNLEDFLMGQSAGHADDSADDDDDPNEHDRLLNPITRTPPAGKSQQMETPPASWQPSSAPSVFRQAPLTDLFMSDPVSLPPASETSLAPMRSTCCVVTIDNLPVDITIRDVLSRISTGEIRLATLVSTRPGQVAMGAVIIFKETRSAREFVHISRAYKAIWTFEPAEEGVEPLETQITYVPNLGADKSLKKIENIPLQPRYDCGEDATRCLVIGNCAFGKVREIWDALRLPFHLRSPHYRSNFEDIWMDGFKTSSDGRVEFANLHIWYTSTEMAIGAKQSALRRPWAKNLIYEKDPCDGKPYDTFFRPGNDPGFAWNSIPSQSLLDVYNAGHIDELFFEWRDISVAVEESRAPPRKPEEPRKLTPEEIKRDMVERRKKIKANGGFDEVTLMMNNTNDYDSDDEGRPGPPRINTRQIMSAKEERQRVLDKQPLLLPNAYVSSLVFMATRAPRITVYSPGTPTNASVVWTELEEGVTTLSTDFVPTRQQFQQEDTTTTVADAEVWDYTCVPEPIREGLNNIVKTHWYVVSLDELMACNETQRAAMGTCFYLPPEGYNTLEIGFS